MMSKNRKTRITLLIVIALAAFSIAVCAGTAKSDQLKISVEANPSTGYYWEVSEDIRGAEYISSSFKSYHEDAVGSPGIMTFKFKLNDPDSYYCKILEMDARNQLPTGRYVDSTMVTDEELITPANFIPSLKLSQNKPKAMDNGKIKVSFKAIEIDGDVSYEIQRGINKNFKKNVKTKKTDKLAYTYKTGLKKGTKYSYRVRAKVVMANGSAVYTAWSNVRTVTCKKTRR